MTDRLDPQDAIESVVRTSYDRLVAFLAGQAGDIAAAEDALAEALAAAVVAWGDQGVPARPASWLLTVAKRHLIGALRREATAQRALPSLALLGEADPDATVAADAEIPDLRLQLLYVCAHPSIDRRVHAPLMLQVVLRLDAARIAPSFAVSASTMGQRLARAKAKIRDSGVPFRIPAGDELPSRTQSVLAAVYAAYGTGWDDPTGSDHRRRGLTAEAERLARLVVELQPADAEARGLLALILHTEARRAARRGDDGSFVPLDRQDTNRWSRDLMLEGEMELRTASALGALGPYQLQAAIQSVHNRRVIDGTTDWAAIAALYDGLVHLAPTLGGRVARAAAHARASGPARGLALLADLDEAEVRDYQPYWATLAAVLAQSGDAEGAAGAARRAAGLTGDPAVRAHLHATYLAGRSD